MKSNVITYQNHVNPYKDHIKAYEFYVQLVKPYFVFLTKTILFNNNLCVDKQESHYDSKLNPKDFICRRKCVVSQ